MKPIIKKYRILKVTFPTAKTVYFAQYKILGIWMNLDGKGKGHFFKRTNCYCETFDFARKRLRKTINNVKRANEFYYALELVAYSFSFGNND